MRYFALSLFIIGVCSVVYGFAADVRTFPPAKEGLVLHDFTDYSRLQEAGLQAGNIIIAYDGEITDTPEKLMELIKSRDKGPVELSYYNGPELKHVQVPAGPLGGYVSPASPSKGEEYTTLDNGVLVESVQDGSQAQRIGLLPGDIILKYGGMRMRNNQELVDAVKEHSQDQARIVYVRRGIHKVVNAERGELGIRIRPTLIALPGLRI